MPDSDREIPGEEQFASADTGVTMAGTVLRATQCEVAWSNSKENRVEPELNEPLQKHGQPSSPSSPSHGAGSRLLSVEHVSAELEQQAQPLFAAF